jgi:lauroyl/myristoyl acyltransferase
VLASRAARRRGDNLLQYVLLWLAAQLARSVPFAVGSRLADGAGVLGYVFGRSGRRAVRANLTRVLGRPPSRRMVRAVFQHGAHNYYDLL